VTRGLRDDERLRSRGGETAFSIDDDVSYGRSGRVIGDEGVLARLGRRREDQSGRRSLTGVEFRRQRSS
jgi:hypothetical protein